MARERMVTRSVNVVEYKCLAVDMTDMENIVTGEMEFTLTGDIPENSAKALKLLQSRYDSNTLKVVAIMDARKYDKMYGMREVDFIAQATELNPETRKAIDTGKDEGSEN